MVSERETDDGTLILVLPRRRNFLYKLLSLIFTIPKERKLSLDDIGRWVWEKCDGQHAAGDIIGQLSEKFNISRKEAEVSLLSFLKDMSKKKLIGFVLAKRDNDHSDE